MNIKIIKKYFGIFLPVLLLASCKSGGTGSSQEQQISSKRAGINEVIVHELSDPDKLKPLSSTSANANYIEGEIFTGLLATHPVTFEYIPILAESRPEIKEVNEGEYSGGLTITYVLRKEAAWDNGEPVTARDIEFTYKAIKNPQVDAHNSRPYFEFIDDFKIDEANERKFTLYCKDRYFMAEIWSGAIGVYPEYIYDPEKLMRKFTIKELNNPANLERLKSDPDIIKFAQNFDSEKYSREKGFVVGCGPYEFEEWITGQRIVLKKKKNWWGNKLAGSLYSGFEAHPDKLVYEVVNDRTTAVTALKDESIDVMRDIRSKDYNDLRQDEEFLKRFQLTTPIRLAYEYFGFNMKNPKLSDKRVRQALCYSINADQIIDVLYYGLAEKVVGPINPAKKYYNRNIEPYGYDLNKASALLDEVGWKDSDGDGVRDKIINGVKTDLSFTLKYNAGNDIREKMCLFFQESTKKIGAKVEILAKEWTVFLDENKNHDFEIFCAGWVAAPTLDDLKQIWHTQSYNGGSNYVGFGNEDTDNLIEKIRYENDETKRNEMYFQMQEILHEEAPYAFIISPKERIAIHKRFNNAEGLVSRPGYMVDEFVLNPDFGTKAVAAK